MRAREFTDTRRMAKIEDTGKIVQILKHVDRVGFSDERGWFLVNTNPDTKSHMGVKWIPDTTRFTWVRDFDSLKENQTATARQVLNYINKTHHEPFRPGEKMYQAVAAHPHWELKRVPLLNLNIPDQEYDDVDYDDQEPESDPYGRVMVVEPEHAGEVSMHLVDQYPIVIDADRYIIDGNHRAWAAKYLLNRDYIMAWVPVERPGMTEAFDRPYRGKWERGEYGQDMLVKLPDGSNLSIMFNLDHGAYGDEEWTVEFWRGNSQDVTGAGDQQRVFATVLSAIKKFIDREHPERIRFSANKAVDPGQKSMSRSNLYDRLVKRYANSWGYDVDIDDFADTTVYNLHSLNESVTEGQYRIPRAIEDFLDGLTADDVGVEEFGPYRVHFEGFTDDCKSSKDYRRDPEAVYQQVYNDFIQREGGQRPLIQDMVGDEDYPILFSIFRRKKPVTENQEEYLYHATYRPLLKSIQARGLGNTTQSQWTDSQPGVVYLARDPEVARSYAETAESVPEEWLDDIVVLQISQADLDPKLLHVDRNVQDNAGDTLEYHAVIPAKLLRRTK